jgi:hypothetical protein
MGDTAMSMASLSKQTATAAKLASSREYFAVLISVGIVVILVLVAIYALSVHHGVSADELGLMVQYP